jgi:DNA polymerase III delta subunit
MVTFIHGDDTTNSRSQVLALLSGKDYIIIDGKKAEESDLMTAFSNDGLFLDSKTIFIDGWGKMKPTVAKICIEHLVRIETEQGIEVFVWEDKTIDKRKLAKFRKAKILPFMLPKYFFTFLDSFTPRNAARLHQLLFQLYPSFAPEQLLYALTNRVRQILMIKQSDPSVFEEIQKMAPFQRSKIQSQAKSWTERDIIDVYKKLFDAEVGLKTSSLSLPLINHIDFLIVSSLN